MENANSNLVLVQRYEAARANLARVEAANKSASTINRAYRALFAAEDALKASGAWS